MPSYLGTTHFQHTTPSKIGLLLVNLGTPEAAETSAVRRYLKPFLSDPRVVEIPALIWKCILHGIILPFRSPKSAEKYKQVWTNKGSPLLVHTQEQTHLLKGYLGEQLKGMGINADLVHIEFAMRYSAPLIPHQLELLKKAGCQKLLILPLYPQYAASTTASVHDAVFQTLQHWRWQPALRTITTYHDFPPYIQALSEHIRAYWQQHGRGEKLLMSFHGIPKRSLEQGDPYYCFCQKTARLLAEALQLRAQDYTVSFQSRFGRAQWLQPYTSEVISSLAKEQKIGRLDVVCPGFVSDCLETLEEIAMEAKHDFLNAGGQTFHYIPALNSSPNWIAALATLCLQELGGWLNPSPTADTLKDVQQRAQAKGASH
jgi:protoporphyrin/coproporphyrin ferrochelatase